MPVQERESCLCRSESRACAGAGVVPVQEREVVPVQEAKDVKQQEIDKANSLGLDPRRVRTLKPIWMQQFENLEVHHISGSCLASILPGTIQWTPRVLNG